VTRPEELVGGSLLRHKVDNTSTWANSRFWVLQLVVLTIYLMRLAASVALHVDANTPAVQFSTVVLFLAPVIFAALNYGLVGAVFTSGWVTILAAPRFVSLADSQNYGSAWAEAMQVIVLDFLTVVVGQRVTAERAARSLADTAHEAHLNAEALYRDLFDSNQAPIIIIDAGGYVIEANASAQRIFGVRDPESSSSSAAMAGRARLVDVIGAEASAQVLTRLLANQYGGPGSQRSPSPSVDRVEPMSFEFDGTPILFRPTATTLDGGTETKRMQVVFEDVTAETRRHDRMEAFAARVVLGQEEERQHLAQELHDGPMQTLIHLCRQIDNVESPIAGTEPNPSVLADLRAIVEDTVAELRAIAKGLRPSILDDLGLIASINQLVSDAEIRHDLETKFDVVGSEVRLSPAVELALFRITQEALSNVERHAKASQVRVELKFDANGVNLVVADDGIGFANSEEPANANDESLGLPGMAERAHLIGSELFIHSLPGFGTTISVRIPSTTTDPI
jgi:signal transduction histidine kinase